MAREGLNGASRRAARQRRAAPLRHACGTPRRGPSGAIAIVGKGITFDSGGLSLKPAKSMETMKYDMAGGSAVLHAVSVAAALQLPVEVTAYVPAAENLPGGRAQKPGDVIRYANGKTVEVLNTDAEGRLVLADALVVASRDRSPTPSSTWPRSPAPRASRSARSTRVCSATIRASSTSSWPRAGDGGAALAASAGARVS